MATIDELASELHLPATELEFLAELDAAQLDIILHGLRSAAARQKEQLEAAIEQSLSHVPRILHKPLRVIIFGKR